MGCLQSSEGKSQGQRETSSGMNKNHVKTEGLITIFDDTQRSAYTRHPEEDGIEGNESHKGTCEYNYSPDSDNEKAHSPNLPMYLPRASSPDLSMQRYDDEVPNINNRPCESNSENEFIIKKVTSDKHSSSPTQLTATTPDMSLQISSRRYDRASFRNSPNKVKANDHSSNNWPSKLMYDHLSGQSHDDQIQSRGRGHKSENVSSLDCNYYNCMIENMFEKCMKLHEDSHRNYSTGDSEEELWYKKITTEGHLPNPRLNRPNRPRASPPPDHLDQ